MLTVDLNCDMGEGYASDRQIMPWISSANIACGLHAGSAAIIEETINLALQHAVSVGAHPSYNDRANFGRVDWWTKGITANDIFDLMCHQLESFAETCRRLGALLHHVKPHGALYNRAAINYEVSDAICRSIREVAPGAMLYGLSGSTTREAAAACNIPFVQEAFADRRYQADGTLVPRSEDGASISNSREAIAQALNLVQKNQVLDRSGQAVPVNVQSICLHGDGPTAVNLAREIHQACLENQINIQSP